MQKLPDNSGHPDTGSCADHQSFDVSGMTRANMRDRPTAAQHRYRWSALSEEDRAQRLASRLTLQQLDAIVLDTRLPGEIAGAYGVTAAVIMRIQQKARALKRFQSGRASQKHEIE
jgi:hypothetical protein